MFHTSHRTYNMLPVFNKKTRKRTTRARDKVEQLRRKKLYYV